MADEVSTFQERMQQAAELSQELCRRLDGRVAEVSLRELDRQGQGSQERDLVYRPARPR